MKLYCFPPSLNSRKIQALALELGATIEPVVVNLPAGEQKKPEYLKINPSGRTPTLVDGDFVLGESNAIMQYIAAKRTTTRCGRRTKSFAHRSARGNAGSSITGTVRAIC